MVPQQNDEGFSSDSDAFDAEDCEGSGPAGAMTAGWTMLNAPAKWPGWIRWIQVVTDGNSWSQMSTNGDNNAQIWLADNFRAIIHTFALH
eukprot:scaffold25475_cov20-Tisochrysis_lutea.AAC.3